MSALPENGLPPIEEWLSYSYWIASPERRAQHWYISFCLMMSSVQDWLTGVALRDASNLNWAATASYYSTVHCCRLLCIIACGDFPTQHNQLRSLFASTLAAERLRLPRNRTGIEYQFDWLRKFSDGSYSAGEALTPNAKGNAICNAIRVLAPNLAPELSDLCPRFTALGALRNDSNYESLLIAHEFNHPVVTELFQQLAGRASILARRAATLARDVFLAYVERDNRLKSERAAFRAATTAYFNNRLQPAINSKIDCSPTARAEFEQFMDAATIASRVTPADADWTAIEEQISMEFFSQKTGLMQSFREKVSALQ